MPSFLARIRQLLEGLSWGQQLGLGGIALGTIGLLIGVAYWSNQPDYTLLFGDLKPQNANRVVQTLREKGTPYKLKEQGTAVYVPRTSVHELRLQFSAKGVVQNGQAGYELFDQGTLGMTDFMQKLNSKRALEGELAQTIAQIEQVQSARVHLVKPKRDPFQDQKEKKASASVVLGLGGGSLAQSQVQGIAQLVSGAVKELGSSQVTILDAEGNMLSDPKAASENIQLTSTQMDMRRSVEKHLAKRGQSMLRKVLGRGNAVVRVSAELDFSRTVTKRNMVDPESATVISEERTRKNSNDSAATGPSSVSTVRNYEVSRTKKRSKDSVGDISRLTVSVVVDYKKTGEDGGTPTYEPRSEEEIAKIASVVKNAVGFDAERGDSFTIQQTRFDGRPTKRAGQVVRDQGGATSTRTYLRYGLILVAIGAAVWLLRSLGRQIMQPQREGPTQLQSNQPRQIDQPDSESQLADDSSPEALEEGESEALEAEEEEELVLEDDMYTSKLSQEAKARIEARSEMFEEIQGQVQDHPEQTAELIRAWIVEDRST
ncbi:MAG: flagellar basal-body MS-ring/collar protein FliF [Salinibacter sp.]